MRRSLMILSLTVVGLSAVGCKPLRERLADNIRESAESDPSLGMAVCGFPVQGLTNAVVTNVTNSGSSSAGSGTATVTGAVIPMAGMPAAMPSCTGSVSFSYNTSRQTSGWGRNRRTTSTMYVYNFTRMGGMPGMQGLQNLANGLNTLGALAQQVPNPMGAGAAMGGGSTTPVPVTLGQTVSGMLAMGDGVSPQGSLYDDFNIQLTPGVPVTIVTRGGPQTSPPTGGTVDVLTQLLFNGAEVARDDDSAGNLNSRIIYTPMMAGQYTIRVGTFGGSMRQGAYTMQTVPGANPMMQ